ncbi:unnamed protein product [Brassica oleracea]
MFDMFRRPRLCLSLLRRPQNPIVGWSFSSSVGLTLSSSMFFSQSVLAITMKFTELMVFVGTPWREEERRIYSVSGLLKLHKRRCSYIGVDIEFRLYASLEMRDSYVWVKLALIQVEDSKKTWDRRRHLVGINSMIK